MQAPAQAPAPQPADDGFWDALSSPEEPKPKVTHLPAEPKKSMAGHQATAHAIKLLSQGYSASDVHATLLEEGVNEIEANRVVESLKGEFKGRGKSSGGGEGGGAGAGLMNMVIGAIICLIGIGITVGTYVAAEPGGVYMLAYGPIIFGGIQFFRGVIQLMT
jgi:hypothetical protein